MFRDYFSLAFRNLKHRGMRSWLTMLGIFIGIATVVSLISLGQGLQTAVTGQFTTLSADRLTIQNKGTGFGPPGSTVVEKLNSHDLKVIESINGIKHVVPRLVRVTTLEYNEVSNFNYIADIPKEQDLIDFVYDSFNIEIEEGRLLKAEDRKKVVIGKDIDETQDFEKDIRLGSKLLINSEEFEVIGILKRASTFQLNGVVFMPAEDLEDILNIEDEYDLIAVQVEDKDQIEDIAKEIEDKLRKDRSLKRGEEDFSVETPLQAVEAINTVLNIINIIVIGIALISLLVGGIGIMNTMYTSVLERRKEIGIMKAVGAKNFDVLMLFLIESGLLGLVGGIIGSVIGLGLSVGISSAANTALNATLISVRISYPLLFLAISFSFVVGVASGVLPALQASKLNVVDSLRD